MWESDVLFVNTLWLSFNCEINDRGNPLSWPRNTLYPQKLALLRQQAAISRGLKPRVLV
jgi:hypothetical protein